MTHQQIDVQPAEILTAIHNNLTQRFFQASRSDAKRAFTDLTRGQTLPFLLIDAGERGEIYSRLALDDSALHGKRSFRVFRDALAAHLHRIAGKLSNHEDLNLYNNPNGKEFIFNIPGIIEADGVVNILVTHVRQTGPGDLTITLTFLDPDTVSA